MKVVIIDDENKIINTITKLIETSFIDISIVASSNDIRSGYHQIIKHQPDILILDINLPDGTGFDLLKRFSHPRFKLIFVTAYEEYAIKAFKFSAIDYILKPIDANELNLAISKARDLKIIEEQQLKVKALMENVNEDKTLKKIVLRTSESLHLVKVEDIIRCEADSNYTFFYLIDGRKILISKTIKEYTELLKNSGFVRVHQSHLINTSYIDRYDKTSGRGLVMKDDSNIPVSKDRKPYFLKHLDSLF